MLIFRFWPLLQATAMPGRWPYAGSVMRFGGSKGCVQKLWSRISDSGLHFSAVQTQNHHNTRKSTKMHTKDLLCYLKPGPTAKLPPGPVGGAVLVLLCVSEGPSNMFKSYEAGFQIRVQFLYCVRAESSKSTKKHWIHLKSLILLLKYFFVDFDDSAPPQ